MKKENYITLVLGVIGGILFALGMCMCLVAEWNAFKPGLVMGAVGAVVLISILPIRRKLQNKPRIKLSGKTAAGIALGIAGTLLLGVGMCMVMVWEGLLVWGIIVGLIGILLLLGLIPLCKGIQ